MEPESLETDENCRPSGQEEDNLMRRNKRNKEGGDPIRGTSEASTEGNVLTFGRNFKILVKILGLEAQPT